MVLEALDAHHNQSLGLQVAPGVQEGPLQSLPLDQAGQVCPVTLVDLVQNGGHNIHHQALPFLPSPHVRHALLSVHS